MQMYRLNRLFHPGSGRCLDVAVDHGFFGEASFISGIEDMPAAVDQLVRAAPDAIQLTPGQAPLLQRHADRRKPALVLRTDVANVYGNPLDSYLFSRHFPDAVEQAVRLDAACVVANLLHLPGRPEVRERCIESIMALREQCTRYGMPLMIEPLVMRDNTEAGGYQVDGDTQRIVALVRQARELGADLIKADPTDDVDDYHLVVQTAVVPVLVRGGGRVGDAELLRRTEALLRQGAAGIVYGRNIIQHPNPEAITRALLALLHDEATAEEALAIVEKG
ncbi:aldolase [Micromonospora sicca]|uniref:Aldolase n=2 Tax=Micromonosporaceae TaxID=28056 RepID=A0A317D054_9ACTN|nr:aldolase [Micromonospora sp. 4G51]